MTGERPRILIVDDRRENLVALRRLLARVDAEVIEAQSGEEALACTLEHEFAVILLDVQMPDMDGYEVAELLRGAERTQGIPIIFVTAAYKDEVHRVQGYRAGAVDYIEKPIVDAILLSKVSVFLDLFRRTQDLKHEIAERTRIEQSLAESVDNLARSNRDLEAFAYVASHDLRQPLRMVKSYLQLLEKRFGEALDQDAKEYVAFACDGAARMDRLIVDLLEYSRVGRTGGPLHRVEMRAVVLDALELLKPSILDCQAVVTVEGDDWPEVQGDRDELVRLLQNLIDNALKYRAPEQSPRISLAFRAHDGRWEFRVRDNGIGIDSAQFERIFGIFQRLHSAETYEGSGIGLAVCRKIVEHHDGHIWVESEPGQGSTFLFDLPRFDQ